MHSTRLLSLALLLSFAAVGAKAQPVGDLSPGVGGTTGRVVVLPLEDGQLDCTLLFEAIADDVHWLASGVVGITRSMSYLESGDCRLSPAQVERLVARYPQIFTFQELTTSGKSGLAVDTEAFARRMADKKGSLRSWLAEVAGRPLSRITKVADTWNSAGESPLRVVVVAAGLHATVASAHAMAKELHARTNLPMCIFAYPNDGPLAESAVLLLHELEGLRADYPDSRITLVAHSMGGLVARAALELPLGGSATLRSPSSLQLGVDQLVQICPPNHGSALSSYAPLLEGVEQVYRLVDPGVERRRQQIFGMITDGFNEAPAELSPTSDFLRRLNRSSRDPHVRYTIIAGNAGPLRPHHTLLLGTAWDRFASVLGEPLRVDGRVRELLVCDELRDGAGDGVVSLDSARLAGVDDFVILPIHHLTWNELDSEAGGRLVTELGSRLGIAL